MYYAHRTESEDRSEWQRLEDHLKGVSRLAGQFAALFGAKEWGEIAGLLHDLGKFSHKFQRRLAGAPIAVDHATAGAKSITERWPQPWSRILAYVIAGHHAGLADFGSASHDESCLARRLQKAIEPYEPMASAAMPAASALPQPRFPISPGLHAGLQVSLFTRMLFSCLVDADSLDTELYADNQKAGRRAPPALSPELFKRFQDYMLSIANPDLPINRRRSELLDECLSQAMGEQGMYKLTLPTGSGKTLISLGFALRHAARHGLRRIIYVLPYVSIIEQNAAIFRQVLGSEYVLEHHSNVQLEAPENEEEFRTLRQKLALAEENWDYPVIVTTNVQLFESLFANKRSRCRKLHNLAHSVIVLDEAQLMNGEFFKPCVHVLEELARNYGVTVVLSTATQPNVGALLRASPAAAPLQIREMVRDVPLRFEQFKRVRLRPLGPLGDAELAGRLAGERQALCIVNTRRKARELYELTADLLGPEHVFHLSARMCPRHRLYELGVIRRLLKQNKPCVLISTQLVECGVDVDFPAVYRELAGLDSIAQAAGRCNRNGKMPELGTTYVFEPEDRAAAGWFGLTAAISRGVLERHKDDPLSLEAIADYYNELYFYQTLGGKHEQEDKTDKHGILPLLNERASRIEYPFQTVAHTFQLIDSPTQPVLIAYDPPFDERVSKHGSESVESGEAAEADLTAQYEDEDENASGGHAERLIESLRHAERIDGLLRKLQPYVVQLYPDEFRAFYQAGEIVEIRERVFKLANPHRWYDRKIGVVPYSAEYHTAEIYIC